MSFLDYNRPCRVRNQFLKMRDEANHKNRNEVYFEVRAMPPKVAVEVPALREVERIVQDTRADPSIPRCAACSHRGRHQLWGSFPALASVLFFLHLPKDDGSARWQERGELPALCARVAYPYRDVVGSRLYAPRCRKFRTNLSHILSSVNLDSQLSATLRNKNTSHAQAVALLRRLHKLICAGSKCKVSSKSKLFDSLGSPAATE